MNSRQNKEVEAVRRYLAKSDPLRKIFKGIYTTRDRRILSQIDNRKVKK